MISKRKETTIAISILVGALVSAPLLSTEQPSNPTNETSTTVRSISSNQLDLSIFSSKQTIMDQYDQVFRTEPYWNLSTFANGEDTQEEEEVIEEENNIEEEIAAVIRADKAKEQIYLVRPIEERHPVNNEVIITPTPEPVVEEEVIVEEINEEIVEEEIPVEIVAEEIVEDTILEETLVTDVNMDYLGAQNESMPVASSISTMINVTPLSDSELAVLIDVCKAEDIPIANALGIIDHESGFNPNALNSKSGCYGYCQLHPKCFPKDLSPEENIRAGITYLANCYHSSGNNWMKAYNIYNCGHYTGDTKYPRTILARAEKWETTLAEAGFTY